MQHFFVFLQTALLFVFPILACVSNSYCAKGTFITFAILYAGYYLVIVIIGMHKVNDAVLNEKLGNKKYWDEDDIPSLCNPVRLWYGDEFMDSTFDACFNVKKTTDADKNGTTQSNGIKRFFGH